MENPNGWVGPIGPVSARLDRRLRFHLREQGGGRECERGDGERQSEAPMVWPAVRHASRVPCIPPTRSHGAGYRSIDPPGACGGAPHRIMEITPRIPTKRAASDGLSQRASEHSRSRHLRLSLSKHRFQRLHPVCIARGLVPSDAMNAREAHRDAGLVTR
jgi:hypothetical protein